MDPASEASSRGPGAAALVLSALVGATLLGASFAGDASGVRGILPVGGSAVVLLAGVLVLVALGRLPAPRAGVPGSLLLVATVALAGWTGATVAWSIVPDRSWDAFDKSAAYAAFLGLGLVLAPVAGRFGARLAGGMLALVLGVVLAWALLAKAIPALDPEGDRVARLREPVGYWNALALLADVALVLGLWLAASPSHRRSVRAGGALLVYVATLALMLTLSRAGLVVGLACLALWLVLTEERVRSGLVLVAAAVPAAVVGGWAFTRPALTEDVAERSDRVADGFLFGLLALAGALVVVASVLLASRRRLEPSVLRRAGRALVVGAVVATLAVLGAAAAAAGDAVSSGRSCSEVVNDPSRLASLDLNQRLCWWEEALDVFAEHGPRGAGAGTFETARKRFRPDARSVSQPHSVPLQHLADGGIAGLAFFLLLVAAAVAVCVSAVRRLGGPERAAAVALVATPFAYLGHALVDYSWDFLAVTAPAMVSLGVLSAVGRAPAPPRRRPVLGLGAVLLAAALLVSFSLPRLADRLERSSTQALADGDEEEALDRALWARALDPLSIDPLLALARVEEARGRTITAERRYIQAVELQPENPEAWYALGIFEFEVRRNLCAAYRFLNNAYTLDPAGSQWLRGGPLDVSREAVNAGGCAPGS